MVLKVTGVAAVLVIWRGRVVELPTRTVPKSSAAGARARKDGSAAPMRLMKSSEELASEVISSAPMRVPGDWGVNATMRLQLAPGTMVVQALETVKSGVVWRLVMWRVVVPVLASVTVWEAETLPTRVVGKVRELCEAV
jgi:hypothetical protein